MGFLGRLTGSDQARTATKQARRYNDRINQHADEYYENLAPQREAQLQGLQGMQALQADPTMTGEYDAVTNSNMYKDMLQEGNDNVMAQAAARGMRGHGTTANNLFRMPATLSHQLATQNYQNRMQTNGALMGLNTGNEALFNARTQGAGALRDGNIAASNARSAGMQNIMGMAGMAAGAMTGNPMAIGGLASKLGGSF